jgi:8-oxo-dGTP pyrophosphatase MutT (NUDIX family)
MKKPFPNKLYSHLSQDYSFKVFSSEDKKLLTAAVVIPLVYKNDKIGFLLTKRSDNLKNHPGQISFPGGVVSPTDASVLETALREWEEEVGSSKIDIQVMGRYIDMFTGTGFHISTIIGEYSGNYNFKLCSREVDFLFELYLDDFYQCPFYSIRTEKEHYKEFYYLDHPKGLLWGATCKILVTLLQDFFDFERQPTPAQFNLSKPPFFQPPVQ